LERYVAARDAGFDDWRNAVVLSFDDGYSDFSEIVMPLISELRLPVTLYVPAMFIERGIAPLTARAKATSDMRAMSWEQIGLALESGLVTIGSHSYAHTEYPTMSDDQIRTDIEQADQLFQKRLGFRPKHFCYPRGKWSLRTDAIVSARFSTAAITYEPRETPWSRHRIVRIPVRASDTMYYFQRRLAGSMDLEERLSSIVGGRQGRKAA
jgi:peptidoglycan/xylan/chitin deacetylase (PgdA/CDA1 family)